MFEQYWMEVLSLENAFEEELGSYLAKRRLQRTNQENKAKNVRGQTLLKSKRERRPSPGNSNPAWFQKSACKKWCVISQSTWKGDMFLTRPLASVQ